MYVMQRIIVGLFMKMFQSPRSGKFISDKGEKMASFKERKQRFNPLDRGNLYQIVETYQKAICT